jgi:RNA polymerase sigma-70 factor, ECF subfamily
MAKYCHHEPTTASSPAVSGTLRAKGNQVDRVPGNLGDLLYADSTQARVSEEEWIALVRAIAAGDQRALRALYERTHRLVFTFLARLLDDRRSAEELTVDTFHAVWRGAAGYDPADGSVLGWIMSA